MTNQFRPNEEEDEQQEADIRDLFITVDNPECKVTAIETFIIYKVTTKVQYLHAAGVLTHLFELEYKPLTSFQCCSFFALQSTCH